MSARRASDGTKRVRGRARLEQRAAGLLLHPTSLPGPWHVGDFGPNAREFIQFLADAGQRWWQVLPTGPIGAGDSPYSSDSAFAGGALLISPEALAEDGLLTRRDLRAAAAHESLSRNSRKHRDGDASADYARARRVRMPLLRRAFAEFHSARGAEARDFAAFCRTQRHWLDDYAAFVALRAAQRGRPWQRWPAPFHTPDDRTPLRAREQWPAAFEFARFVQYEFDRQWAALRREAARRNIGLIGDLPIFVALDSCDVWRHRHLFDVDRAGRARSISGCPPDGFSPRGQLWGHPQYLWSRHRSDGFIWWLARFRRLFEQFDVVRIDHFLGFHRVWSVPGGAADARRGRWRPTAGAALLAALQRKQPDAGIIAEDLGVATPAGEALRERFELPGMRVLQFGFDGDGVESRFHQPHRYPPRSVAYTGTHDNDTIVGWHESLPAKPRAAARRSRLAPEAVGASRRVLRYLGLADDRNTAGPDADHLAWAAIRSVLSSPADLAIIPAQDVLALGSAARMNTPGVPRGNWRWRLLPGQLTPALARRLRVLVETFERA